MVLPQRYPGPTLATGNSVCGGGGGGNVFADTARRREGVGSGAHVDTGHGQQSWFAVRGLGQDSGGRANVRAGIAREGEGVGTGAHVDTGNGPNLGVLYAEQAKMAEAEQI
jgi:hypothetical protein